MAKNSESSASGWAWFALLVIIGVAVWVVYHAPVVTLGYIKALVWPVVALTLALTFKSPLSKLVQDVFLKGPASQTASFVRVVATSTRSRR